MAVGVKVGSIIDEIGTSAFFHAFFSTISYHLEKEGWGSTYPCLMNEFYQGKIASDRASLLIEELKDAQKGLKKYKPKKVIWDIEDLTKKPPWGNNISPHINSLANYFVTSTGKDIFEVLIEALEASIAESKSAEIVEY
jgi:2,3-bisphosphoglycerate-dependent phosphoglycerate mutase